MPSGSHSVTVTYETEGAKAGLILSILGVIVTGACCALLAWNARKNAFREGM